MIPIRDLNPTRHRPLVTYLLIAANVLVFLWQNSVPELEMRRIFYDYSVVPLLFTRNSLSAEALLDGVRSMFLHGSWLHLGSNMLYLWIFGDNVEDQLGKPLFLVVYLLCGYVAVLAQVAIDPNSPVPMVGASGAIAGVLGCYIVMYPRAKVLCLIFFGFIFFTTVPAAAVLGLWFFIQLFNGFSSLGAPMSGGGVAVFAHIGGFVAGMVTAGLYRASFGIPEPPPPTEPASPFPNINFSPSPEQQNFINLIAFKAEQRQSVALHTRRNGIILGMVIGISPRDVTLRDFRGFVVNVPLGEITAVQ